MALNWSVYPLSGRTQYFGNTWGDFPSGLGWSYEVVTTGATGIYSVYNDPVRLITDERTDNALQLWFEPTTHSGFEHPTALQRTLDPVTNKNIFALFLFATAPGLPAITEIQILKPNYRKRFTLPPLNDFGSGGIPDAPNAWTVTPLTLEQENAL